MQHSLPFTQSPSKIVTHMVFFVVKLLNYFPAKGGVSTQYSPKTIMSGQTLNYKQCSLPFGTYCQVHEEDGPRNSLLACTSGAISIGPSSNRQGGHLFFSLNTNRILARRAWTVLPTPQAVIDKINSLGRDQPSLMTFTDMQGNKIGVVDNNDITPPQLTSDINYEIPGVVADIAPITGVDMDIDETENNKMDIEIEETDNKGDMDATPSNQMDMDDLVNDRGVSTLLESNAEPEPTTPSRTVRFESTPLTSNKTNQRPTRERRQPKSYVPTLPGKSYQYSAT